MSRRRFRVLIVDDEKDICDIVFTLLEKEGFAPIVAHDGETALEMIRRGLPDLVVSDVRMPKMDGMELLKRAKSLDANLPVIMITGWGGIQGAVEAMRLGAYDYLAKPLHRSELAEKIRKALEDRQPSFGRRITSDATQNETISQLQETMGPSEAVARIVSEVALVAPSDFAVIIQGETGTGKELVARAIHGASLRSGGPLIPVDCGAIPETLFESELFGYEKGAFTGASTDKPGKFELGQGGTLFLDEISNMPLASQIKLLRTIQEKTFFRVGGTKPVSVDVRLIVATNEDLNRAVHAGTFSRDLFYRLSEFTIKIPALRERQQDIIHIAKRILHATNYELGKKVSGFSEPAVKVIQGYIWPGNVRQLRSAVRRAVLQAQNSIGPEHLLLEEPSAFYPEPSANETGLDWTGFPFKEIVRRKTAELERQLLTEALTRTGGNQAKAARLLQIDYSTIRAKLRQYGIKTDSD